MLLVHKQVGHDDVTRKGLNGILVSWVGLLLFLFFLCSMSKFIFISPIFINVFKDTFVYSSTLNNIQLATYLGAIELIY